MDTDVTFPMDSQAKPQIAEEPAKISPRANAGGICFQLQEDGRMIWISAEDVILIHSRAIQGSSRCAYCRRLFF